MTLKEFGSSWVLEALHTPPLAVETFELPVPPNRANDSQGWQARCFSKKHYFNQCSIGFATHKPVLQKKLIPWQRVLWKADFFLMRAYDSDNLVALCKWPLDFLVHYGYLKDDDPHHCWAYEFPTQTHSKEAKLLMTVRIYPS